MLIGLAFPIVLVFLQLGFSDAVMRNATVIYDALDFDIVLLAPHYVSLMKPGGIPRVRLYQTLSVPEVRSVAPLYVGFRSWRNAENGERRELLVIGIDPRRVPFTLNEAIQATAILERPDMILFDRLSRPEYGPHEPGTRGELGLRRVTIGGEYTLGAGFIANATVLVGDETFVRLMGNHAMDEINIGLVQLTSGADRAQVVSELQARLPRDVTIWSRPILLDYEREYWRVDTSVGIIFGTGVAVGFAVLVVLVYQLVSTDIVRRLREYATMKALGYTQPALFTVVMHQALVLVATGVAGAFLVSLGLYSAIVEATNLPVQMTVARALGVLGATLALSMVSAFVALRRLAAADPADLF